MIRRPPRSTRTDTLFTYTTLFRSLAQIAQDRADGYRLVLATASYRLYVEPIARRLGFDAVIATDHLSQDLRYVRARIAGENCYDTGKLRMIKAWMAAEAIDRTQDPNRAFSDHEVGRAAFRERGGQSG